jgi:hypothetical protein
MSPPGAWCVDRILFGIHDDHVDAGLRCASIGAVGSLRALCLPTFSHFLNVTKPFLSLSLSLSLSLPIFFSPGWQVTCVSPYVRSPFPSKEIWRISERDNPGPPVVQLVSAYMALGFRESGFGNRKWTLVCTVPRFSQLLYRYKPSPFPCLSSAKLRSTDSVNPRAVLSRVRPRYRPLLCVTSSLS